MGGIIGQDCKLYYSATELDGSSNTPSTVTWVEITPAQQATVPMTSAQVDISTRGVWKSYKQGQIDAVVTFGMVYDVNDSVFNALRAAAEAQTRLAFAAMDGAIGTSNQQGFVCNAYFPFTRDEPLDGAVLASFTVLPYDQQDWYVVS